MNRIFKVVWRKTKGYYVVASELAKNHQGGSCRIKRLSAAIMAVLVLTPQMTALATTISVNDETWFAGSAGSGVLTIEAGSGISLTVSDATGTSTSKSMTLTISLDDDTLEAVSTAVSSVSSASTSASSAESSATEASTSASSAESSATEASTSADSASSSATAANSVAIGAGSVADEENTVSVGSPGNERKITNVAAGEVSATSTDAVNGSQLYSVASSVSNLSNRVNKVGANAAALAALHPLDFDPTDKVSFAVGYGNYRGENAMALGAFYRPNDNTMFSIGGTMGNGENMINVGASFKFGSSTIDSVKKAQYQNAPMSTMNALEDQVQSQQKTISTEASQIEELQAQVRALMEKAGI